MKASFLAIIFAAGVSAGIATANADEVKKLRPHPDATADQSVQQASAPLPEGDATQPGGAAPEQPKPQTGVAAEVGGESSDESKHD